MVKNPGNDHFPPLPGIRRRQFLKLAALTGALAGCGSLKNRVVPTSTELAQATSPPTATTAPSATATATPNPTTAPTATAAATPVPVATATTVPTPTASATGVSLNAADVVQVAFVKTDRRAEGVRRAIDLLGVNPVGGKRVLLKPNLNSADPTPGSTHPAVLRAMVTKLQEMGAGAITVGDRSGVGSTASVLQKLGVHDLGAELGFDVVNFDRLHEAKDWTMIQPPDSHWKRGFPVPRLCLDAEAIVQTCCLKTHQYGGHFTMSLKNSVGMCGKSVPLSNANFMDELHSSAHQRKMIAEINYAYEPALIVLDGVEAFTAGGPMTGRLVSPQVVLASTDRIAMDAVGVALLRHFGTTEAVASGPIFDQEQIARAVELGLGVDRPEKIQLLTDDPDSEQYAAQIRQILLQG